MAAAKLVVKAGMSQPHSSIRLLGREGGRGEREGGGGWCPYRLCINEFYNLARKRNRKKKNFLLPPLRALTCVASCYQDVKVRHSPLRVILTEHEDAHLHHNECFNKG